MKFPSDCSQSILDGQFFRVSLFYMGNWDVHESSQDMRCEVVKWLARRKCGMREGKILLYLMQHKIIQ